ncbi:carboxypeptidase-like regulatory domain-containing protein [Aquisphaera insulae]|uniref:carboxypeptidase-like regulatory domain-containing protein n=1 Tax=Aquisphaera insulae TaxID=2712864 RepID=UPI0013ED9801|nr:carboxypeptidase-like regulatory domain-containing protein [Aquisphaera insulae]
MVAPFLSLAMVAILPATEDDLVPVTVAVVNRETHEPVRSFRYQAWYDAPDRRGPRNVEEWTRAESPDGTFRIDTPRSCRLTISIKAADYVGGYPHWEHFPVRSDDRARRIVVGLHPGITVRGTVRDEETKAPIAGARVTPLIPAMPGLRTDEDKAVTTGADGRYEVHGVGPDFGLYISHPDHAPDGDSIRGMAVGPNLDVWLKPMSRPTPPATPAVPVPQPTIELAGRVIGPDGRPVEAFTVVVGAGESPEPERCVRREVRDGSGRFRIGFPQEGTTWVGIAAAGFAFWDGRVEHRRGGPPIEVRLAPGVSVTGRLDLPPEFRSRIKAQLRLHDNDPDVAARTAPIGADGRIRFEHVRPDRWWLWLQGEGIPLRALTFDVPAEDVDFGTVRVDTTVATGRIEGRAWQRPEDGGGPRVFDDGFVGNRPLPHEDRPGIEFLTGEDGRFRVDRVPVGLTTVGFPHDIGCVLDEFRWRVLVVPGRTTEVLAFDPEGSGSYTLAFAIGDGSAAQFDSGSGVSAARRVERVTVEWRSDVPGGKPVAQPARPRFRVDLSPVSKEPVSFADPEWKALDSEGRMVLSDIGAGTYRMRISDWQGLELMEEPPFFEETVVIPRGGRGELRIPLGAGCITGRIPRTKESRFNPVEVTAVARGDRGLPRHARCDDDGNFCVRYLSPGTYTLFVHDPRSGRFARVDGVAVKDSPVDIGERPLEPGATIRASIRFERPSPYPWVEATGPLGGSVQARFGGGSARDLSEFPGLWPGRWTISARAGRGGIATAEVEVKGTGSHEVDLVARGKAEP